MSGVLIVDDYASMRQAVGTLLTSAHIEICGEADNGEVAIEKVEQLHPELVLLDINMPVLNGIQACREIRCKAPDTKIVFFTLQEASEHQMRSLGADGFVSKATAQRDLIPTVEHFLMAHAKHFFSHCPAQKSPRFKTRRRRG
jgi:two-component system response regulator NreC